MIEKLDKSIVKIVTQDGKTVGTGFCIISGNVICTCAHVITFAGSSPGENVSIILHKERIQCEAFVEPAFWSDDLDIAILRIDPSYDSILTPLMFEERAPESEQVGYTFGFPQGFPEDGIAGRCKILGIITQNDTALIQAQSTEITPGFSGAPVITSSDKVIGLVSSIAETDKFNRLGETCFITPASFIIELTNELTQKKDKQGITLAVLSDLKIGKGARSLDLCPTSDNNAIDSNYIEKFKNFITAKKISADYMLICGDISNQAEDKELQHASDIIIDLADFMNIDIKNVVFAPGDSDIAWNSKDSASKNKIFTDTKFVFSNILMNSGFGAYQSSPHFSVWDYPDMIIIGYNSSWGDNRDIAEKSGHIANEHISEIENFLKSITLPIEKLKIFLVHHHPIQYTNPANDDEDLLVMRNAPKLLDLLQRQQFDILIHGHLHRPYFDTLIRNSGFPLSILSAGSFSAMLDTSLAGHVNNQFHLVKVDGRDADTGSIYGFIENYTYLSGDGWQESKRGNGIHFKIPFGPYVQPNIIKNDVSRIIQTHLKTRDYTIWSDIVKELPHLLYINPERIIDTLDQLGNEIHFKRHGQPPDEIVILRKK